jgi:pimeloyl-ACP methyl ester carboxylesterase
MKSSAVPSQILFLPGALGRTQLWEPVAGLLSHPAPKRHIGWPGFGSIPSDSHVNGIDDLVRMVTAKINQPTALVSQSMGGVIAARVALERPELITHLVLAVTSGGIDVGALGGQDWRPSFHESNPQLPHWFSTYREDLSAKLPAIFIPTLLLWGDSDPISPVCVGERLASLLPCARLHVVEGGDHDLAETHASSLAPLIDEFISTEAQPIIPLDLSRLAAATGQ